MERRGWRYFVAGAIIFLILPLTITRLIVCDWQTHGILYQWTHPWHWLANGNNAGAVQALVALLALIGLTIYTIYTRKMRDAAFAQLRAQTRPILNVTADLSSAAQPSDFEFEQGAENALGAPNSQIQLTITNIGPGPATMIVCDYRQVEKEHLKLGRLMDFRKDSGYMHIDLPVAIPPNGCVTLATPRVDEHKMYMALLYYRDVSLNRYQSQCYLRLKGKSVIGLTSFAEPRSQPDKHPQSDDKEVVKEPLVV
jgi:hypothetical protein